MPTNIIGGGLGPVIAATQKVIMVDASGNAVNFFGLINGSGIAGPNGSTSNAVVRWSGASGAVVYDSPVVIDDSGNVDGVLTITNSATIDIASDGALTLGSNAGVVNVNGFSDINIAADSDLNLNGNGGNVNILAVSDLSLTSNTGGIDLTTITGDITLDPNAAGKVYIKSTGGFVEFVTPAIVPANPSSTDIGAPNDQFAVVYADHFKGVPLLVSPNLSVWQLQVSNGGVLSAVPYP